MICSHCKETSDAVGSKIPVSGDWGDGVCETCGALLTQADTTSALLAKLSQLARFGLAAEDGPLLESAGDRD